MNHQEIVPQVGEPILEVGPLGWAQASVQTHEGVNELTADLLPRRAQWRGQLPVVASQAGQVAANLGDLGLAVQPPTQLGLVGLAVGRPIGGGIRHRRSDLADDLPLLFTQGTDPLGSEFGPMLSALAQATLQRGAASLRLSLGVFCKFALQRAYLLRAQGGQQGEQPTRRPNENDDIEVLEGIEQTGHVR